MRQTSSSRCTRSPQLSHGGVPSVRFVEDWASAVRVNGFGSAWLRGEQRPTVMPSKTLSVANHVAMAWRLSSSARTFASRAGPTWTLSMFSDVVTKPAAWSFRKRAGDAAAAGAQPEAAARCAATVPSPAPSRDPPGASPAQAARRGRARRSAERGLRARALCRACGSRPATALRRRRVAATAAPPAGGCPHAGPRPERRGARPPVAGRFGPARDPRPQPADTPDVALSNDATHPLPSRHLPVRPRSRLVKMRPYSLTILAI